MSEPMDKATRRRLAVREGGPEQDSVERYVGRRLKTLYDDVVRQPVPDRFLDLLAALEKRERGGS